MTPTTTLEELMEIHREIVQVGKEHGDALDSFRDDDSNWLFSVDESSICKTGNLKVKYDFLVKIHATQVTLIEISRELIANRISQIEDTIGTFEMDFPS